MDKSQLLTRALPIREVQTIGGAVTVRALSRSEAMALKDVADDPAEAEVRLLAAGMVDPALTEDEVRQWLAAWPAGAVDGIETAIMELSGIGVPEVALEAQFR